MFNERVSYFKHYNSDPETIQLYEWLDACMDNHAYNEEFEYYRTLYEDLIGQGLKQSEIKEKLNQKGYTTFKRSLPLVTVGAVCEGGRAEEHVARKTGWISLDIDRKDNPRLKDFRAVRDEISKVAFVAFSALSAGGQGVWALVKVKDPNRQEDYFRQLLHDFETRGIILDRSKGKNPNDARFFSYDPEAKIKRDFKIYDRLPTIREPKAKPLKSTNYTDNVFEFAMNFVKEKYGYTFTHNSDMHVSLVQFCSILNWKGVTQKEAEEYIDENILSLSKITTNCISGPYEQTEFFGDGAEVRTMNIVDRMSQNPANN